MKLCISVFMLSLAAGAAFADESPLCEVNRSLIDSSLKVIAQEKSQLLVDDIEAIGGRRPDHASKAIYMTNAWGQINASLLHMQALGCKPFSEPIDPNEYTQAALSCEKDRSRERKACAQKTWARNVGTK